MKQRRKFERLTTGPRDAAGDLLVAFIFAGWELFMPIREATEVADTLAWHDPDKAKELSGYLVRGEPMPPHIQSWIHSTRDNGAHLEAFSA